MGSNRARETATDAVAILQGRYVTSPQMEAIVEEERVNSDIARLIHDLRTAAGLTQEALAELVGISVLEVSRLEDADYKGHPQKMLRRVAGALERTAQTPAKPAEEPADDSADERRN